MFRKTVIVLVILLIGVLSVQAQSAAHDISFFLTYVPNIQFAPVYVALEKGYFANAGLNVTLQSGDEPDGINLVGAGQLQFALASGEQIIAARAQGRPVKFVYAWYQKYPIGVVVTDASGIKSPADLKGKQIGIPGLFGASYTGVIALLSANNLTEQDVQLQTIGYNAPQVICVGGVQAAVIYVNNEPLEIQDSIDQHDCGSVTGITVFPVSDAATMVSNGIITNDDTIANDPVLVKAFVDAFDHGLRDTINNPAEAYLLSVKYIDGLPLPDALKTALTQASATQETFLKTNPTRAALAQSRSDLLTTLKGQFDSTTLLQVKVLLTSIDLWDADQLGYSAPAAWQTTEDALIKTKVLTAPVDDLSAAYTNDFVPTSASATPQATESATVEATAGS